MDGIHGLIIYDFNEKIQFLKIKPTFNFEQTLKMVKPLNNSITVNYLPDYLAKNADCIFMDTSINSKLKVKISLVGDIIIFLIYDYSVDIHSINMINQRLVEALHTLIKAKKIKIELLLKKYMETILLLDDTLYLLDPRVRLNNTKNEMNLKDPISHSIYIQKFQKAGLYLRSLAYLHSSKEFSNVKNKIEDIKNLRVKNLNTKLHINEQILKKVRTKKVILRSNGGDTSDVDFSQIEANKKRIDNSNNISVSKSINDPNLDFSNNSNVGNKKENNNKFNSSSKINLMESIDFTKIYLKPSPELEIKKFNSNNENYRRNSKENIKEAVSSLNNIDLGSVLNSINFANDSKEIDYYQNSNRSSIFESKSVDFNFNNFNTGVNTSLQTKANDDLFTFNNIISSDALKEDKFDKNAIKKQIRGVVLEKGILLNNKGKYEEVKYRGQIALELSNNFSINNKTLYFKAFHPFWNDNTQFTKVIADKAIVEDQNFGNYKVTCQNTKTFLRLLDYNINIKLIEQAADFKINGLHKEGKYKLEILCLLKDTLRALMKGSQMVVVIMLKQSNIKIIKSTDDTYIIEDKKITFTFNNFSNNQKFLIGMMFDTVETELVEVVKVIYRYMDVLPTSNSIEVTYLDDNGQINYLDIVKKCMVEARFIP